MIQEFSEIVTRLLFDLINLIFVQVFLSFILGNKICAYKFLARPVGQSLPLISFLPTTYQFQNSMEFKKVNFSLEGLVADVSTTQETQYTAPLTRSKAKKLAEKAKANVVTEEVNLEMLPNKKGAHDESIGSPSDSAASVVMPVMMTNTTTVEDQISNLAKIVEGLVVHAQSQDAKIVKLMAMVENIGENSLSMSKQKSKV